MNDLARVARATNQAEAEFVQSLLLDAGIPSMLSSSRKVKRPFAGTSHAGGETGTPDTRIMIPQRFGSTEPKPKAGGRTEGLTGGVGTHAAATRLRVGDE